MTNTWRPITVLNRGRIVFPVVLEGQLSAKLILGDCYLFT
jgi:hypothetical protein